MDTLSMEISLISLIGYAAAICTTAAYLPQVMRAWRTKSTADISLGMFSLMSLGVALWIVYGISIGSVPVIAANGVTLVLTSAILFLKLRHG
jgi:MtN3 and saliva related transmembrane protein